MAKPTYRSAEDAITFNIINEDMVKRLQRDGEIKLPKKKVAIPKDKQWNKKFIHAQTLQGILEGESALDIADRIFPEIMRKTDFTGLSKDEIKGITKRNRDSAIRNARTMITSAENHGRLDSYNNLSDQGVVMVKVWQATPDERTRPTHIDIDGEEQDIKEPFTNGCMYPGDGNGPAEEVWMCRCAMGSHILGFRKANGSISKVNYKRDETMHDRQMAEEKQRRRS